MRPTEKTMLWLHLAFVGVVSVVAYLDLLRALSGTLELPGLDKVLHFVLIGGVAYWWTLGWNDPRVVVGGRALPLAVMVPLGLATLEEGLQFFSPYRNADLFDWLADLCGLLAFWLLARWRQQRRVGADELGVRSSAS